MIAYRAFVGNMGNQEVEVHMRSRFILLVALVLCLMPLAPSVSAASTFASPAFETQWKQGEALAPNFWGPLANATPGIPEEYHYSGTNKTRLVQYFDKGRMERYDGVTNTSEVRVTNGLLATEMVKGQIQIADDQFMPQPPPDIAIAGDPGGSAATYADLGTKAVGLLGPAQSKIGQTPNDTIQPSGDGSSANDVNRRRCFTYTGTPTWLSTDHDPSSAINAGCITSSSRWGFSWAEGGDGRTVSHTSSLNRYSGRGTVRGGPQLCRPPCGLSNRCACCA